MAGGDFGQFSLQIGPEQIDEYAALLLRQEQRRAMQIAGVDQKIRRVGTVA